MRAEHAGRNVWHEAHNHAGDTAGYLSDIHLARQDAEETTDIALRNGMPAESIGLEIRYALIASSLAARATVLPPDLIVRLVQTGAWRPLQGLTYGRQIDWPQNRADVLARIAPHFPLTGHPNRSDVFAEARLAAEAVSDARDRAEALGVIAGQLGGDQATETLNAAYTAITDIPDVLHGRDLARLDVITQLSGEQFSLAVSAALEESASSGVNASLMAERLSHRDRLLENTLPGIRDDKSQALFIVAFASHFSSGALINSLRLAVRISDRDSRLKALDAVTANLPPWLEEQAFFTLRASENEQARADGLMALLPYVLATSAERVQQITSSLGDVGIRAQADARVEALFANRPQEVIDQATRILDHLLLRRVGFGSSSSAVAATLATSLNTHQDIIVGQLLDDLRRHGNPDPPALARIAAWLPEPHRAAALIGALRLVTDGSSLDKDKAFVQVLRFCPDSLLGEAASLAEQIPHQGHRAKVLTTIATRLPAHERIEILRLAIRAIEQLAPESFRRMRHEAYRQLAPLLDRDLAEQARSAEMVIGDLWSRSRAMAAFTERLSPSAQQREGQELALSWATAITTEPIKISALAAVMPRLPADLAMQALQAVIDIRPEWFRGEGIAELAPNLPASLVPRALEAARQIISDHGRVIALASLTTRLSPEERPEILNSLLDSLSDRELRPVIVTAGAAMAELPERNDLIQDALAAIDELDDLEQQVDCICALLPLLPSDQSMRAVRWAARLLLSRDDAGSRHAETLQKLSPYLDVEEVTTVMRLAQKATISRDRANLLAAVLSHPKTAHWTSDTSIAPPVRILIQGFRREPLLEVLRGAAQSISRDGGNVAVKEVTKAINDVSRWWH